MTGPLFSASWYRVANLTPRIRPHAEIHRHEYRGQLWYVLEDRSSQRFHRFSPPAYLIVGLMDGRRTVQELWDIAMHRLGDEAPTQDEMIHLLSQLHAADVLRCDVPPDAAELLRRHEKQQRRRWLALLGSLVSWRIPLLDPERFLRRFVGVARPFVGIGGVLLWLAVVAPAIALAAAHWHDLTRDLVDRVLAPRSLALLWLAFPLLKAFHEMGHAFTVKSFGGEVHDMGIMLLVVTPVPYVDASSASALRSKWRRIAVGAAGMMVELFIAALAMYVWLGVQPGAVRTLAYNVIFLAGVSTVVFNANPLLRYDGYYILADFLEIPNLRAHANSYLGYLVERYAFGRPDTEPLPATRGERAWFVVYAIASFVYRVVVVAAIAAFIASKFFYVGLLMVAATGLAWVVVPVGKGFAYLFTSRRLRRVRLRALSVTTAGVGLVVALVGFVPVPFRSRAEGVVWIADEAIVRAGAEGFVERVVARPGARVRRGDVLVECRDPTLEVQARVLAARLRELRARYDELRVTDRGKADLLTEEIAYAAQSLSRTRERLAALVIRARADGVFVAPLALDLPGRLLKQGEMLAHVLDLAAITVRTVVAQSDVDLVRHRTRAVQVRLAERLDAIVPAVVKREVPGADEQLPSSALGVAGGGQIAVDPSDARGQKALGRVFQLDLELPSHLQLLNVGGRVHVRFDHGRAPLAAQGYRFLRQLLLHRFSV
jgi:putative peptide zinc metalloprotease protein